MTDAQPSRSHVDVNSHALPPPPDAATPLDNASNPLSILALMEEATAGLAPKLLAGGLSCMFISAVLNPMGELGASMRE